MPGDCAAAAVSHYGAICRAMRPGLLITVNNSDASGPPSDELRVESVSSSGVVSLTDWSGRCTYYLHPDRRGETVLEEVDEDGYGGRETVVETIEVVGVDE